MNRSQRCGVCAGCQSKPCGACVYCQDSPQFGGPGVKKQSCLERRCHRVLENRLQRDAPTFKAKAGCNQCDDCLHSPECQVCLVCLDRKFFHNRYLPGAMCAKKRCNQSRAIEMPQYAGHASQQPPPGSRHELMNGHMIDPIREHYRFQQHQQQHPGVVFGHVFDRNGNQQPPPHSLKRPSSGPSMDIQALKAKQLRPTAPLQHHLLIESSPLKLNGHVPQSMVMPPSGGTAPPPQMYVDPTNGMLMVQHGLVNGHGIVDATAIHNNNNYMPPTYTNELTLPPTLQHNPPKTMVELGVNATVVPLPHPPSCAADGQINGVRAVAPTATISSSNGGIPSTVITPTGAPLPGAQVLQVASQDIPYVAATSTTTTSEDYNTAQTPEPPQGAPTNGTDSRRVPPPSVYVNGTTAAAAAALHRNIQRPTIPPPYINGYYAPGTEPDPGSFYWSGTERNGVCGDPVDQLIPPSLSGKQNVVLQSL